METHCTGAGAESGDHILRKYYTDKDYITSLEGVLKVLSAMACVVSGVLFLGWTACPRAPALAPSAAGVALACGGVSTLLFAGVVLDLPLKAPQPYLLTVCWAYNTFPPHSATLMSRAQDIIVSTVLGLLLLVTAVLSMTVCEFYTLVSYLHGPLAVLNAGMVIGSAVITYVAVMRLWDAARPPCPPAELDV